MPRQTVETPAAPARSRVLRSRRAGRCVTCNGWYGTGDSIRWTPGVGAAHVDAAGCARPTAAHVITAAHAGLCGRCGKWYACEASVLETPGAGMTHLDDAACAAALVSITIPPVPDDPVTRWQTFEAIGAVLEARPWTFARTMADVPHFWSLRREWADDALFDRTILTIRQYGQWRKWRTIRNLKLDVNEWYYWTMANAERPPSLTGNLNRARRLAYEVVPAPWFPQFPRVLPETRDYLRTLAGGLATQSVLDIGGLWLDAAQQARAYLAIGTPGDLARLSAAAERPPHVPAVIETRVRDFLPRPTGTRYDVVAALFGAANHLDDDELTRLPLLLKPGGVVIAMFVEGLFGGWTPARLHAAQVETRGPATVVIVRASEGATGDN